MPRPIDPSNHSIYARDERMDSWGGPMVTDGSNLDDEVRKRSGIEAWWTDAEDAVVIRAASEWRWLWALAAAEEIRGDPSDGQLTWRGSTPQIRTLAWYNVIHEWVRIRGHELNVNELVEPPRLRKCPLCQQRFYEDSLPYSMVERLGAHQIDHCRPCLERTLWDAFGSRRMGKRQIAAWIAELVEAAQIIPAQEYPSRVGDLIGVPKRRRTAILEVMQRQPTRARVRRVFGSWFQALVAAGVLDGDAARMTRGTRCIALDGHVCHSLGEKTIDDLLHRFGVPHEREPRYPGHGFRGDFLVNGTIVEYRGLSGDPAYDAKQQRKRDAADQAGLRVVDVLPSDVVSDTRLRGKLGLPPTKNSGGWGRRLGSDG